MARVIKEISLRLRAEGLLFSLSTPTDSVELGDVTYVDDYALTLLDPCPRALVRKLTVTMAILDEEFYSRGLSFTYSAGKMLPY